MNYLRDIRFITGATNFFILALFVGWLVFGEPSTKPSFGSSVLLIHTDALTGCEYLSSRRGSLTPRLDGLGKQIGCR